MLKCIQKNIWRCELNFFRKEKTKIEVLYEKYKFLLFKIAKDILKSPELAEDIVHQTFVKVIENKLVIEEVDSAKTRNLLAIICRNLSINVYNKMKQKEYIVDEIPQEEIKEFQSVEDIVISNYNVEIIMNSIMELPDIYRDVLLFEKVYGYTKNDISHIFEISIETVNKRSQRAKEKLTETLNEKGVISGERK